MQALSVDVKLHKLFDEARHEGKNEMDFAPPPTELPFDTIPTCAAEGEDDAHSSSDMCISSEDINDNNLRGDDLEARDLGARFAGEDEGSVANYMSLSSEDINDSSLSGDELAERNLDARLEGEDEGSSRNDSLVIEDGDPEWEDETASDGEVEYTEEDDEDEINMEAYGSSKVDENGVLKTEQGGVIHLVHGWTQRGHPNEVGQPFMLKLHR